MNNQTPTAKNNLSEVSGVIDRFLFQSTDNGYCVCVLQTDTAQPVTICGYLPDVHPGEQVQLRGSWTMHPKFGKQFQVEQCTKTLPTSVVGLKKYLASGLIKGIGPSYAERLVDHFGVQVLEIIDKYPERLQEVPGIGKGRATKIMLAWQDQRDISAIMVFLQEKNISPTYAIKIYKTYGQNSIAILHENPYRLADDIWGIGFKIADQIAHNLGLAKDSVKRIRAGMLFAISTEVGNGHLYVELAQLKKKSVELLELDSESADPLLKQALHELYDQDKIKLISHDNRHFITLSQYYHAEKGCANKIAQLLEYPTPYRFDLDQIYTMLRAENPKDTVVLNDEQQQGIMACLQHKITVITGGPGTGKTTLIKKLLAVLDANKAIYKLAAPTGRAAKRITEGTGRSASTLHRLLEFDFVSKAFTHDEKNALQLNFLIVDEASMIDVFLAYSLLKALPLIAHVVFIGDVDQLPSVGAGNFLNDLIASGKIPCIKLKQVFRQAQDSLIIVNAHRINMGEFPTTYLPDAKRDFFFIKEDNPEAVPQHLHNIFTGTLRKYGISAQDAAVLIPMNKGLVGTQKLNIELQKILNPENHQPHLVHHGTTFKIGDRVMQIRNNYDKRVFNGDIGTIHDINTTDQTVHVYFQERPVEYDFAEFDEIVLAYAITIHKSQGSEYAAAIIPIFMQHFTLLQRNLIYTAITRAKKLCILIGQAKAIGMAINNNKGVIRTTFLQQYLTSDLQCR